MWAFGECWKRAGQQSRRRKRHTKPRENPSTQYETYSTRLLLREWQTLIETDQLLECVWCHWNVRHSVGLCSPTMLLFQLKQCLPSSAMHVQWPSNHKRWRSCTSDLIHSNSKFFSIKTELFRFFFVVFIKLPLTIWKNGLKLSYVTISIDLNC